MYSLGLSMHSINIMHTFYTWLQDITDPGSMSIDEEIVSVKYFVISHIGCYMYIIIICKFAFLICCTIYLFYTLTLLYMLYMYMLFYLMGDFNINTMYEISCTLAQEQEIINLFSTLHYQKLLNLPTRVTQKSSSLLPIFILHYHIITHRRHGSNFMLYLLLKMHTVYLQTILIIISKSVSQLKTSKLIRRIELLGLVRGLRKKLPKRINYWLLPSVILLKETRELTRVLEMSSLITKAERKHYDDQFDLYGNDN